MCLKVKQTRKYYISAITSTYDIGFFIIIIFILLSTPQRIIKKKIIFSYSIVNDEIILNNDNVFYEKRTIQTKHFAK